MPNFLRPISPATAAVNALLCVINSFLSGFYVHVVQGRQFVHVYL